MILHITTREQWAEGLDKGLYRSPSLKNEGFIHCSKPEQIIRTANEHYSGCTGLVLLCIWTDALVSPLVLEDSYAKGEAFPHIYGPLNLDAVRRVYDFPSCEDGLFTLPKELVQFLEAGVRSSHAKK